MNSWIYGEESKNEWKWMNINDLIEMNVYEWMDGNELMDGNE